MNDSKLRPLRVLRQEAGLSQAELAARAGVDPHTVNRIETGKPASWKSIRKVAKALGCDPTVIDHTPDAVRGIAS